MGLEVGGLYVQKVLGHLLGGELALVGDCGGGEGIDVEASAAIVGNLGHARVRVAGVLRELQKTI